MAILGIHEAQDVLCFNVAPTGVDADEWGTVAHRVQMLLQLYIRPDLFSVVNMTHSIPLSTTSGCTSVQYMVVNLAPLWCSTSGQYLWTPN